MKMIKIVILFTVVLFSAESFYSQPPPNTISDQQDPRPDWMRRNDEKRQEMDKLIGKDRQGMIADRDGNVPQWPMTKPDGKPYTRKELEKIKALSEPHPSDLVRYAEFLRTPNTGIFRLFPFYDCVSKGIIRVDGDCATALPDAWSYSFRGKNHEGLGFYDIRYKNGELIADGFVSQEILVRLGDIPLERVSLETAGLAFLNNFKPEVKSQQAKKQYKEIENEIGADGHRYSHKAMVGEDTTYALRVVAYRNKKESLLFRDGIHRDKWRTDVTLAFRIVGKDEDGSLTILWKELKRQKSPKLIFDKTEKWTDIKDFR